MKLKDTTKKKIKKISTVITCVVLAVVIASLCSVAYLRDKTNLRTGAIVFNSVEVTTNASMRAVAPTVKYDGYDKTGYYIQLTQAVNPNGTEIPLQMSVTNDSDRPVVAYLYVVLPVYKASDGEIIHVFKAPAPSKLSNWMIVTKTMATEKNGRQYDTYVYGYGQILNSGETTDKLDGKLIAEKMANTYDNGVYVPENDYTKFGIQVAGIGFQGIPDEVVNNVESALSGTIETYDWNSDSLEYGKKEILDRIWGWVINREINNYFLPGKNFKDFESKPE